MSGSDPGNAPRVRRDGVDAEVAHPAAKSAVWTATSALCTAALDATSRGSCLPRAPKERTAVDLAATDSARGRGGGMVGVSELHAVLLAVRASLPSSATGGRTLLTALPWGLAWSAGWGVACGVAWPVAGLVLQ